MPAGATRYDGQRRLVPTFSAACHVVSRIEWEDATSGRPELETAYTPENLIPLEQAGLLRLLERPSEEIVPGLRAVLTGGHTRGHLALLFESPAGKAIYLADVCPTTAHLRRMWCTAYDVDPLQTRRCKPALLGEAADAGWQILWNHDAKLAVSRVERHPKREFVPVEGQPQL